MLNFSVNNLFFTADTHFGHSNIIKFCHRPFATVGEMDDCLIQNWNAVVPEDAVVFHLGDFCLDSKERWKEIFRRLNGKEKYLIVGNHDEYRIAEGYDPGFTDIKEQMRIEVDGQPIVLNHTPLLDFESNVWQLFGHVHSGPLNYDNKALPLLKTLKPTQYDVGVDNNGYKPVSYMRLREIIEEDDEP